MQADVIALRLDSVNLVGLKKQAAPGIADRQPVPRSSPVVQLFQQRDESCLTGRGGALSELRPSVPDRLAQPIILERLEQIVERVDFKGADGVLIKSGHEDDQRQTVCRQRCENSEPVQAWHLHVEK